MQERAKGALAMIQNIRETSGMEMMEMTEQMEMMLQLMQIAADSDQGEVPKQKTSLASVILLWEEMDFPSVPFINEIVQTHCTNIVTKLSEGGFLGELPPASSSGEGAGDEGKDRGYMALHALLPILLRAQGRYDTNAFNVPETSKEAFILYYCYRTKEWPWSKAYYNPSWSVPRQELHVEFANFATVAEMGMQRQSEDSLQLI
jgi:hypothetical protein